MFETLTKRFQGVFAGLLKSKKLTEENLQEAVREVRLALLDADVSYAIASDFVKRLKEKALGTEILKSLSPSEQFIKLVHDELTALMGGSESELNLKGSPAIILLCGLQGSGKTTQAVKLTYLLKGKPWNKKVLLAACDLQRPAAVLQLQKLAQEVGIDVFSLEGEKDPLVVAKGALEEAKTKNYEVLIVDTAGRLHIDPVLMEEIKNLKQLLKPQEVLFVASAVLGQQAAKIACEFDTSLDLTGVILTMLDGDARGGAALSIKEVTKKPLKFEGVGEKIPDLQVFNPSSMADRILGMGDVVNLAKKVEQHIDQEEKEKLEAKMKKAQVTYEDYLKQMAMVRRMGSLSGLLKMLPGAEELGDLSVGEAEFKKMEAMIFSMTEEERCEKVELEVSRRRRIAKGSGTTIDDVNKMVKSFRRLKQFLKDMPALKKQFSKTGGSKENFLWH